MLAAASCCQCVDIAGDACTVSRLRWCCAGANIASDAESIRLNLRDLAAEQLPPELQAAGRTEVLPVQWRKHLSFSVSCCSASR